MNQKLITFLIVIVGLFYSCTKTDNKILSKTVSELNSLEKIELQTITHYKQKEMGLDKIDTAYCYFDFSTDDSLIGAKYQIVFNQGLQVYNGSQAFSVDDNEERIIYTNEPELYDASSSIFMMNSLWSIKKLLPIFINDTLVTINRLNDTIIHDIGNYVFKIELKDKYINIGAVLTEKEETKSIYNLLISKKTYLPTEFTSIFPDNQGFWSSSFSSFNLNKTMPDSIWDIDKLPKEYMRLSKKELSESFRKKTALQVGQKAIDWKLPLLNSNDSIQLSNLNSSLVLLEFWFPYCSGCVVAIPEINEIYDKYLDKGLKVYGIEIAQPNDKGLLEYIQKQNIKYPTLHTGKEVANNYGVNAAPTFLLIDKDGIIKYASVGLNKDELINAIEDNIK